MKTILLATATVALVVSQAPAGQFFVEPSSGAAWQESVGTTKGQVDFNAGYRGGVVAGYELNPVLQLTAESGLIYNNGTVAGRDVSLTQFPVLFGIQWASLPDCAERCMLWPFWGVSVGPGVQHYSGAISDTYVAFDYQAQAGVSFVITPNLFVVADYRLLRSAYGEGSNSGNQSVNLGITWNF